jgi:hypothetical protein
VLPVFWAAWKLSGDTKYLAPFQALGPRALETIPANALDQLAVRETWGNEIQAFIKDGGNGRLASFSRPNPPNANSQRLNVPPPPNYALTHFAWAATGDKRLLESLYASQIEASAIREFMNTEGSMWTDRIDLPYSELQRARLGGVALVRNLLFPGHAVSWTFQPPANEESVGVLIPNATPQSLKIVVYNLSQATVKANLRAWDVEPGQWEIVQGVDQNGDDVADGATTTSTVEFERSGEIELTLPPRVSTVLNLKLVVKGIPYWARPDLGISAEDVVSIKSDTPTKGAAREPGRSISVTVHSLGAVSTEPTTMALVDRDGKVLLSVPLPSLEAPVDLWPRKTTITFALPAGTAGDGCSIVLDPDGKMKEITRVNNRVTLP